MPALEPVVGRHREHLDVAAGWGVPAHVTVLYPFAPPDAVDEALLGKLAAAIGTVPQFRCTFAATDWFGHDVLWLRPGPVEPFRALTKAVLSAFPQYLPYGGCARRRPRAPPHRRRAAVR